MKSRNVYMVFGQPPADAVDDFNRWYDEHLGEILSIPGFRTAQRYRLDPIVVDVETPVPYSYVALFEYEGDPDQVMQEMEQMGLSTRDSYIDLKKVDGSGPELPDWWDGVRFLSWSCVAIGNRLETAGEPAKEISGG